MSERPLHPVEDDRLFQHPIKGCVFDDKVDRLSCFANDAGERRSEDDIDIYVGVEVHRSRVELGLWLEKQHPAEDNIKNKVLNHLFVEAVFPIEFEEHDKAETQASLKRVDLAQSVIDAGGACTICGAPNDPHHGVDHLIGCEYMSWLMYVAALAVTADREPTLDEVVRSAEQQIARMQ